MTDPIVAAMSRRGSGSLVFISSVNALGHYGNPAYSAAKAGLVAYAKAIAVERGGQGVRANVVCPGSVRTPAWDHRLAADPPCSTMSCRTIRWAAWCCPPKWPMRHCFSARTLPQALPARCCRSMPG